MTLGEILRDLLEYREISQKELADKLSLGQSTIGNYFQDIREPDYTTLKAIADVFDVSTDFLLDHRIKQAFTLSHEEDELLDIFHRLTPDQQEIFLLQGKLFLAQNLRKEKEKSLDSKVAYEQPEYEQET